MRVERGLTPAQDRVIVGQIIDLKGVDKEDKAGHTNPPPGVIKGYRKFAVVTEKARTRR